MGRAITGRPAVAALYGAVTELVPGEGSDFAGPGPAREMAGGRWGLQLHPKPTARERAASRSESWTSRCSRATCRDCQDHADSCELSELPDGSQLLSYAEDLGGGVKRLVVEHYVGDIRVSVASINAPYTSAETLSVTRPEPVLSIDQLTQIATQPWWSLDATIDSPYEDKLPSYEELFPPAG